MVYALDTNILVYAHNTASPYHEAAKLFVEKQMNSRNEDGSLDVCLPAQVVMEFINVVTWERLGKSLSVKQALEIVQGYLNAGVSIINQHSTQLQTFLELMQSVTTRKKIFDVSLAATLKDNGVTGLYTVNTKDFEGFSFLNVTNPLV